MSKGGKLELTWPGKEHRPRLEPRILLENSALSHHAAARRDGDLFDNLLIQGDNLLALKALEQDYAGRVKCVFIDPPYNTGSAFEHYDDGLEHSLWLSMMRDRLELIHRLLADDGSLWVTLDDNEAHYFKVMCDEVFGRANFVANVVWQKRTSPDARLRLGDAHDHLLVYCVDRSKLILNKIPQSVEQLKNFKNPDNDHRGPWSSSDFSAQGYRPNQMYVITTPGGVKHSPPPGMCWKNTEDTYLTQLADNRFWFGRDGKGVPRRKTFLSESQGVSAWSWWSNKEVGHNQEAKKEIIALFGGDTFPTPKPERLVQRIIHLATNPGDLVLDSFAGSGTTGAVAHKMGRRWIMVELGDHAVTHIVPRLKKVIDGADPGGVTEATGWKGGGGYRFQRLAPSLLAKDPHGNWVIAPAYDAAMLAEAVCKHLNFTYDPSPATWWMHGRSTETDFLYVTTQALTLDALRRLSEDVGTGRSLLVACRAYETGGAFENLTLTKIPAAMLKRCEWGRDDYSLAVESLPRAAPADLFEAGAADA